jgi:protoheme IX farnesyltransferase
VKYEVVQAVANSELVGIEDIRGSIAAPRARSLSLIADFVSLTKPRITALVLLTGAVGTCLASSRVPVRAWILSLLGTALIVGSANALNMWWERDVDARMMRTRARPLPSGRVSPELALAFGLGLGVVAAPMLFLVNAATGLLGVLALVTYVVIYTPLKRRTPLALLVGAVPGAMPPLLGWSTATGAVQRGGLLLFALLFLWQIPHFAAIAIFRADDYARAGLPVVSVRYGEQGARRWIAVSSVLVAASSLLFVPLGLASKPYTLVAAILDSAFVLLALRGVMNTDSGFDARRWAKRVFAASIPYLTLLLVALLVYRIGP